MEIVYTWNVTQTDYKTANGFITKAYFSCTATDGENLKSINSTCSWSDGTPTIPYADVTMQEVLDWIWASGLDKEATEASVEYQLNLLKNPVMASGLPWQS